MPKYMVVIKDEDGVSASFFSSYLKANDCRLNAECGMGAYTELYVRDTIDGLHVYVFLES